MTILLSMPVLACCMDTYQDCSRMFPADVLNISGFGVCKNSRAGSVSLRLPTSLTYRYLRFKANTLGVYLHKSWWNW